MKMKMVLFFFAVLLTPVKRAFADPDPNLYIFLCFGQSNMEGVGQIEGPDRTVEHRFQVLADFDNPSRGWKKGQWYTAIPPLTRRTRGISLVDYFGRTMVANLPKNIRVGVVKVGVSGTKIELWDKDSQRCDHRQPQCECWLPTREQLGLSADCGGLRKDVPPLEILAV